MARLQGAGSGRDSCALQHPVSAFVSTRDLQCPSFEDHVLPGRDISRIEPTTATQAPTSPENTNGQGGHSVSQQSPEGGISIVRPEILETPTGALHRSAFETARFSTNSANVGRRRSMLLHSPARPGHTSRIKQIFDEASCGKHERQNDEINLYPQLPNISRGISPSSREAGPRIAATNDRNCCPGSLFPLNEPHSADLGKQPPHYNPTPSSERSSGSWTDDSGYINLDWHSRGSPAAGSSEHRIQDWLSTVSEDDDKPIAGLWQWSDDSSGDNCLTEDSKVSSRTPSPSMEKSQPPPLSARSQRHISNVCKRLNFDQTEPTSSKHGDLIPSTPLGFSRIRATTPDHTDGEDEGSVELSPLSPNVCIKRGPSRYHSRNNARLSTPPTKPSVRSLLYTPSRVQVDRAKENRIADEDISQSARTLRTLGSARKGRFWRPSGAADSPTGR